MNTKAQNQKTQGKRSEKSGIFSFVKDMGSSLLMALIAIIYVIQAFKIPTSSMENSLLIGDFLLGLKFIYGAPLLPFSYLKLPAFTTVKPGDIVIFEYPGNEYRDYIKRCVAGPGQTVEIRGTKLIVDGKERTLPPNGIYTKKGNLVFDSITNFSPLRIPAKGDTLKLNELPVREFLFAKNLISQENPRNRLIKFLESFFLTKSFFRRNLLDEKVHLQLQLYIDGIYSNNAPILATEQGRQFAITIDELNKRPEFTTIDDWISLNMHIDNIVRLAQQTYPGKTISIGKILKMNNKAIDHYIVKNDNYFMLGDNRDNSMDSRYWGYLNRKYVKAKAFILYFSWNGYRWCSYCKTYTAPDGHNYHFLAERGGDQWCQKCHRRLQNSVPFYLKIRWNRIGKLIRAWDKIGE